MNDSNLLSKAKAILAHAKQETTIEPTITNSKAEAVTIEPAATNARSIYWEAADGRILGPAVPEFLPKVGEQFWVVTSYEGQLRWIRSDRLRTRQAFEMQQRAREGH